MNPKKIAEDNFQSWCEQYNDNCNFQKAWDVYADKYGAKTELLNLLVAAIEFGVKVALIEVKKEQVEKPISQPVRYPGKREWPVTSMGLDIMEELADP